MKRFLGFTPLSVRNTGRLGTETLGDAPSYIDISNTIYYKDRHACNTLGMSIGLFSMELRAGGGGQRSDKSAGAIIS